MKNLKIFLILVLAITFFQSCEVEPIDEPTTTEEAPALPPQSAFVIPFDVIDETETDTEELTMENPNTGSGTMTYKNWFHAAGNVFVWNTVIALNTAIPIYSYAEAFNHDPVFIGNGTFLWAYDFQFENNDYIAALTAKYVNDGADVNFVMKISKVGGFSEFEWYNGVVAVDGSGGVWTLNQKPNNPTPLFSIVTERDGAGFESIRYINIVPGDTANGHYIEFRNDPANESFNRAYDVYRGNDNQFLEIRWDEPSYEGQVKHPAHFNDDEWHCWDENQIDTDC